MKRTLSILALLVASTCVGADLVWNDPNPSGVVTGYRVWRAESDGAWRVIATVSTNRWKIVLPAGAHKLGVTSVGGDGVVESDMSQSKIIVVLIAPETPRIEQ